MALTYDDITAITNKHYRPVLVDNIFNDIPLFKRFKERNAVMIDGGEKIKQPLLYAVTGSVGSYSGYDVLSTTPTDQITAAEYEWKQSYANITIDGLSVMKNSGTEAVFNLLQKRVQVAQLSLADDLATQLYSDGTGNDSKDITGLQAAVDNGDNVATYGGIARGSYTWWKSDEQGNSGTNRALTIALMEDSFNAVEDGTDAPTVITMDENCYRKFWSLAEADKSLMNVMQGAMGLNSLSFNGLPIIKDRSHPANMIFFLNEKYLELFIHRDKNFVVRPFQEPYDQDVMTSKVFVGLNLASSNCRRQGRLADIDPDL